METNTEHLKAFLESAGGVALVEVVHTKGSAPREAGTFMLVSNAAIHGTIGGGQLEYMAIDKARQILGDTGPGREAVLLDIPLGPEIGQCCGGRVEVAIRHMTGDLKAKLLRQAEAEAEIAPRIYVFGGGHVGRALARVLSLLPVVTTVVETRADALEGMPGGIETKLTPVPEEVVRSAPQASAFIVLTHDHALDFLIVTEALKRTDAAYVGMIGSKTKKATFRNWFLKSAGGTDEAFARLVCPIGGDTVRDKRPSVIATLVAAEVMTVLAGQPQAGVRAPAS